MRFLVNGPDLSSGPLAFYESPHLTVEMVRRMNDVLIRLVFLSQLASTLYMTGFIWFVQVVHCPLLVWIGESELLPYEQWHMFLTNWVVAPPMLIETVAAVLLAGIRLSTALLQVPCHETLSRGLDPRHQGRPKGRPSCCQVHDGDTIEKCKSRLSRRDCISAKSWPKRALPLLPL